MSESDVPVVVVKPVCRQILWQRKQKARGNCVSCGRAAYKNGSYCQPHGLKKRNENRKGYKPKQKNGRGRPCLY